MLTFTRKESQQVQPAVHITAASLGVPGSGKSQLSNGLSQIIHMPPATQLWLSEATPAKWNQSRDELEKEMRYLTESPSVSSPKPTLRELLLGEAADPDIGLSLWDGVGQMLTRVTDGSRAEEKAPAEHYLSICSQADMLLLFLAVPWSSESTGALRKLAGDIAVLCHHVRGILSGSKRSRAVCIALTKIDSIFSTAQAAREKLTDAVLLDGLAPLVRLLRQTPSVVTAAAVPVSSWGFGNAVLKNGSDGARSQPAPLSHLSDGPTYLLKDASMQPFGVAPLLYWLIRAGLLLRYQEAGDNKTYLEKLVRVVASDLESLDPWICEIK